MTDKRQRCKATDDGNRWSAVAKEDSSWTPPSEENIEWQEVTDEEKAVLLCK